MLHCFNKDELDNKLSCVILSVNATISKHVQQREGERTIEIVTWGVNCTTNKVNTKYVKDSNIYNFFKSYIKNRIKK